MIGAIRFSMQECAKLPNIIRTQTGVSQFQKSLWTPSNTPTFPTLLSRGLFQYRAPSEGSLHYTPSKSKEVATSIIGYDLNSRELKSKDEQIHKIISQISAPDAFVNDPKVIVANTGIDHTEDLSLITNVLNVFSQEGFNIRYTHSVFQVWLRTCDDEDVAGVLPIRASTIKENPQKSTTQIHQAICQFIDGTVRKYPGNSGFKFRIPYEYAKSVAIDWVIETLKVNGYSAEKKPTKEKDAIGRDKYFLVCTKLNFQRRWERQVDLPQLKLPELDEILKKSTS